jgi:glycosyltransferase involved in cell wall biosynthesis
MKLRLPPAVMARLGRFGPLNGFDAAFYLSHNEDLGHLRTRRQAERHYLRHGRAEGRFASEAAFLQHGHALADLRGGFDVAAYKFFNKDLARRFQTEAEFFRHYVRHGHAEGRICNFPQEEGGVAAPPPDRLWQAAFSMADFLAWSGAELPAVPTTRADALRLFEAEGIDRLWPINLEYAFDPAFVRAAGTMPRAAAGSDAGLYRAWLTEGFPAGIAPNEAQFLAPLLGGLPFPPGFAWHDFARAARLPRGGTRGQALAALFGAPADTVLRHVEGMGQAAAGLLHRIGARALEQGDAARAVPLLARALALGPAAVPASLLGDAHRALGDLPAALAAYETAVRMDGAPLPAFVQAAEIHAANQDFPAAFALLRQAHRAWRQQAAFGPALHRTIQLFFEHASAQAHALYRQGGDAAARAQADRLLADTLDRIAAMLADLDGLPAATGGNPDGYVVILANDDLRQCTHYRIEQKRLAFDHAGLDVRVFSHADVPGFMDSLIGARAAIFYRVAAVPEVLRAIVHARAMGLATFYEVDDLIFDPACYPDPIESFEGQITQVEHAGLQFGVPLFRQALAMCETAIASTPALAERMQAVVAGGRAIVLRNGLDGRNDAFIRLGGQRQARDGGRVRIFYGSGTKAHNADFNRLVAPALADIMRRHPQVDLVIVGHLALGPELDGLADRVIVHPFIADLGTYWSILAACDINLAVLAPGPVADCKSEIKWLEAAILQVPSIVSGTRTLREVIAHGADGMIADTPEQWRAGLDALVTRAGLRTRIGAAARATALRDYALPVAADTLRQTFAPAAAPAAPRRLRVLLCNVFFAPQSYGGATRVVEDNVRDLLAGHPELEIAVFCSDEGATPPGSLTMDTALGVPVYRVSVPHGPDMETIPFNPDNAALFERVLDHFRPDIVHFHCVQRLTATIVEVARHRSVPYVVTVHDGWWISDHQFLVDRGGSLCLPGPDPLADAAAEPRPAQSLARRLQLAALLRDARAVVSVSSQFAAIYAAAGIAGVRVIENGVPDMPVLPHVMRSDGRIALGHVGGRLTHKGATLVEAALRRNTYAGLHLTMVDMALAPAEEVDTVWGTTPVTLIGPCAQREVPALYARLNVLLAPSIWPESFGLVAREASRAGLWVVASDRGAMGADVEQGRDGFVIDVSTAAGLAGVLAAIDADPATYRRPPAAGSGPPRTMAAQAGELAALYDEIAASSVLS